MALLRVNFFFTSDVADIAVNVAKLQVEKGNAFLRLFNTGIQIDRWPTDKAGHILPWRGDLAYEGKQDVGLRQRLEVRMQCHQTEIRVEPRVPVIFCGIKNSGNEKPQGEAVGTLGFKTDWPPFILINARNYNPDGLTLLHEIGHCVGLRHPNEEPRLPRTPEGFDQNNLMGYGAFKLESDAQGNLVSTLQPRCGFETWQITALRTAYFYAS